MHAALSPYKLPRLTVSPNTIIRYRLCEADRAEAFAWLREGAFDLLRTDLKLPGSVSGLEIAEGARAYQPDAAVLILIGSSELADTVGDSSVDTSVGGSAIRDIAALRCRVLATPAVGGLGIQAVADRSPGTAWGQLGWWSAAAIPSSIRALPAIRRARATHERGRTSCPPALAQAPRLRTVLRAAQG